VADKHPGTHGNKYSNIKYKYKYKATSLRIRACSLNPKILSHFIRSLSTYHSDYVARKEKKENIFGFRLP